MAGGCQASGGASDMYPTNEALGRSRTCCKGDTSRLASERLLVGLKEVDELEGERVVWGFLI